MTYMFFNSGADSESYDCEQEDFMCGQSLATCIIALILLLVSVVSVIVVCRNIMVKFSLFIIFMI